MEFNPSRKFRINGESHRTINISQEIKNIAEKLQKANFQAYLVGGCVRDVLISREPKDWDIATDAKPEEIQKLFPGSVYENKFGTVLVKLEPQINADINADKRGYNISANQRKHQRKSALDVVEVTTFRLEGKYTDKRHPDEIKFAKNIEEDLSRRDFTINAMAMEIQKSKIKNQNDNSKLKIIDPYAGENDLKRKVIRTVGKPEERFGEDALRLMRAVRIAAELDFT